LVAITKFSKNICGKFFPSLAQNVLVKNKKIFQSLRQGVKNGAEILLVSRALKSAPFSSYNFY